MVNATFLGRLYCAFSFIIIIIIIVLAYDWDLQRANAFRSHEINFYIALFTAEQRKFVLSKEKHMSMNKIAIFQLRTFDNCLLYIGQCMDSMKTAILDRQ